MQFYLTICSTICIIIHYHKNLFRFFQDFKTLADVLIQETIRHDLANLIPHVKGEETNKFENTIGEKITVEITDDPDVTHQILLKVLANNEPAAKALTNEIHKEIQVNENLNFADIEITENLAIWVDPIDGTQEYISGIEEVSDFPNIFKSGLKCATVLIGVYEINTGIPLIGVINQPFERKFYYGFSIGDLKYSSVEIASEREESEKIAILSSSESLKSTFKPVFAAGAGYKSLKVIEGHADVYLLSKPSTFKWDSCGPHAILRGLGGGMLDMKRSLEGEEMVELSYLENEGTCNEGGIIAYRRIEDAERVVRELRGKN